jgi:hypothetical protein
LYGLVWGNFRIPPPTTRHSREDVLLAQHLLYRVVDALYGEHGLNKGNSVSSLKYNFNKT